MSSFDTYDLTRLRCLHKARLKLAKVVTAMKEREDAETLRLHRVMTDLELDGVKAGGVSYSPYEDDVIYVDDEAAFEAWAEVESPELLHSARPPRKQQLNQEVRRRQDDGLPLPPGVKLGQPRPKISMRKS